MKYSVALMGYYKPRYGIQDKETGILVAESYDMPKSNEGEWLIKGEYYPETDYNLIEIDGWKNRSSPGDIVTFKPAPAQWTETEKKEFLIVTMDGLTELQMSIMALPNWDLNSIPANTPPLETVYPAEQLHPNRFAVELSTLSVLGVDIEQMLDKTVAYLPEIRDIVQSDVLDKKRNRKMENGEPVSDFAPVTFGDIPLS